MVKLVPSSRNKKLSVIKEGFKGRGPLAADIRSKFSATTFLCNSLGKPIYYEGPYKYAAHKRAYERAKLWMPIITKEGSVVWKQNPNMKPFSRLLDPPSDLNLVDEELYVKPTATHRTLWNRGAPPMQIGMIGEFKGEKAIVIDKGFKKTKRRKLIGIGDPQNLFLSAEDAEIDLLGAYTEETIKPTWVIQTTTAKHVIYNNSRWFKRKNCVIKDFDSEKHLKKYLGVDSV